MKFKTLGRTGEKIPAIGIGTWQLSRDHDNEARVIRAGLERGMRFIDTAEIYNTEGIVSKAIEGQREVFIATKVWPDHFRYQDVIKACEGSLRRLGIKKIDLYQLHWPSHSVPIEETMKAMEKLADDGKIRYIGVSNFSVRELEDALAALKRHDVVSNQVEYSVVVRDPEKGLLEHSRREGITIIAYSPLDGGHLFERRYVKLHDLLGSIAKMHSKTMAQVALNWVVSKENVTAIPKASSMEHMLENAAAADFQLSDEEIHAIDSFSHEVK